MGRKSKLDQVLSAKERAEFFDLLGGESGLTLTRICEMFEEFSGVELTMRSAETVSISFDEHLARIRLANEQTVRVLEIIDTGNDPLDAAIASAKAQVFDALSSGVVDVSKLTKSILDLATASTRLRESDLKQQEMAAKLERAEKARDQIRRTIEKAKAGKAGLSRETRKEIEEILNF